MTFIETQTPNASTPSGPDQLYIDAAEVSLAHPDVRLVGSVARAAIMGTTLTDRRESGILRDIDIVRFGERGQVPALDTGREVDTHFEDWISSDKSHLVFPRDPNLAVPIKHSEVFETYDVQTQGGMIRTLHPDVVGKLNTLQYIRRPKDKVSFAEYDEFLNGQADHMDAELLQPFDEMRTALSRKLGYRARGALRNMYYGAVPETTRKRVQISRILPGGRKS